MKINKNSNIIVNIYFITAVLIFAAFVVLICLCGEYEKDIGEMQVELNERENTIAEAMDNLENAQDQIENQKSTIAKRDNEIVELNNEIDLINKSKEDVIQSLDEANAALDELKKSEYKFVYMGDFKITHYCNEAYKHICGYGDGLTAIGTKVKPGYTIAVDPKVIPYGTKVYIEGYGWRVAEDCGGGVADNHIDVAVDTHSEAMAKGVKHRDVWVLVKTGS